MVKRNYIIMSSVEFEIYLRKNKYRSWEVEYDNLGKGLKGVWV